MNKQERGDALPNGSSIWLKGLVRLSAWILLVLGLDKAAEEVIKHLRLLLAAEPSIHGSKKPELPTS